VENRLIFGLTDDDKSAKVHVKRIVLTKAE
jgi:hypothetical protein